MYNIKNCAVIIQFFNIIYFSSIPKIENESVQTSYFGHSKRFATFSTKSFNFDLKLYSTLDAAKVKKLSKFLRFGVLTTTYIRAGSTKMFNDYLRRYA